MITSPQNPKIKWVRMLQDHSQAREQEKAFVVEGVRLVEEAWLAGWQAELVIHTQDLSPRGLMTVEGFENRGVPIELVSDRVMRSVSDTETPQGILAVLRQKSLPQPPALDFVLIPDSLRDPGNLGTMLRTAAAAKVQAVWIPPNTADPFAPKVVRAGMGAHFHLPIIPLGWDEIAHRAKLLKEVYLAAPEESLLYTQADLRSSLALIIGGEATGASTEAQKLATAQIHIPMPGGAESLNAAVAAGVLMFEVVRQRTSTTSKD